MTNLYPQVEIEVHTAGSSQVIRKVNEQEIDIGLAVSQLKFPELILKKVGTDFIAGFQKDISKLPSKILINPDMQLSATVFRKYSQLKKVIVRDYELIAKICLETNSIGFLPESVSEKYPDLIQVGGAYLKSDIFCITHKEKMSSLGHKKIFAAVVNACVEK